MGDRTLKARCPCGHTIVVEEPKDGVSIYGRMGQKMARHEPCSAINHPRKTWTFDHGYDDIEVP